MQFFRFTADSDNYGYIDTSGDWEEFETGVPSLSTTARSIKYIPHKKTKGDFPSLFPNIPVFSNRAHTALGKMIGDSCQFIEAKANADVYWIANVIDIVDALDHENSQLKYYPNGKVMRVASYSLKAEALKGKHFFKIPESLRLEVLVSEDFRELVRKEDLKGAIFEELP